MVKIEPKENIVFVGEEKFLQNRKFKIRDLNWLAGDIDLTKGTSEQPTNSSPRNWEFLDFPNPKKIPSVFTIIFSQNQPIF